MNAGTLVRPNSMAPSRYARTTSVVIEPDSTFSAFDSFMAEQGWVKVEAVAEGDVVQGWFLQHELDLVL